MTIISLPNDATVEAVPFYADYGRHHEDGHQIIGDDFHVWVTLADGTRYEHFKTFHGYAVHRDPEEGSWLENTYRESKESSEALARKVAARGRISLRYWREIEPAYGSDQYIKRGCEAERAFLEQFED